MDRLLGKVSLRWKITLLAVGAAVITALAQWAVAALASSGSEWSRPVVGLACAAVAIAAAGAAVLGLTGPMVRPVTGLRDAARAIAAGDLTRITAVDASGELAELADSFATMLLNLQQFLSELATTATTTQRGAGEILSSVARLAAMSAQQAAAINETTTTASEIAQTAKQATAHADSVIEITQRSDELSRAGLNTVEEAVKASASLGEQVNHIATTMADLSERTQQVGEIIASVKDLAEQSNLLALNASIEASKAGESGRGFSVVAMEMRNLAEQSKQAAVQVRSIQIGRAHV